MVGSSLELLLKCGLFAALIGPLSLACQVDDRQLQSANATAGSGSYANGSGGHPAQTCTNVDTSDSGSMGGALAQLNSSGPQCWAPSANCPDLDQDNVRDNAGETLVTNPTLDTGIEDWNYEVGAGLGWNADDACGRTDSGSLSVTNPNAGTSVTYALSGAMQCLIVSPGKAYALFANLKPSEFSYGGVGLAFHTVADCTGNPDKQINSTLIEADDEWHIAAVSGVAPEEALSVAVRLVVGAPSAPPDGLANVLFDNVLVTNL